MEKNNTAAISRRGILSFLLSLIAYASLSFIIRHNLGYIPLKLVATDIYIPVYYWLVFITYTYIYSAVNKIKFSSLTAEMLMLGLFLHIYLMLLGLNQFLLFMPAYSKMYLYYAFAVETGLLAIGGYFFLRVLRSSYSGLIRRIYLCSPLLMCIIYHLYRDVRYINIMYFCFHLVILAGVLILFAKERFAALLENSVFQGFLKKDEWLIILIFVFSFIIRSIFAFNIIHITAGAFPTASDDGPTYHDNAILIMRSFENIISGKKIIPSAYDPGYSIFLGFIYKIFGPNFYAAALIQSVLNSLMVLVIYLIAKAVSNRGIGLISAIFTALNQPLIMFSVVLTTEALFMPLLVFSLYCLIKFLKNMATNKKYYYLFVAGILMGFAIITRAMLLLFPGLILCWLLLYERGIKWIKSSLVFISGLAPAILLITVLTYTNTGEWKIFTSKQDPNWVAFTDKKGPEYSDPRHVYSNAKLIEMGINPYKDLKGSVLIILKDPVKFLKIEAEIIPRRLKLFLFYPNCGNFDPIFILSSTTPNQYASTMEFYGLLIFVLGLISVLVRKQAIFDNSLMILLIFYFLFIHVVINTGQCGRYKVPLNPFFIIFAANGIYLVYKTTMRNSLINRKN